ncbi:hypothetical protein ACFQ7F_41850 [Streptomyces sp. NPDC056486]|uniref:hypothetical protein n=1 Tax=Streptomyces sp. NPDC056486 TaxID=3345835 RepID=UPI003691A30E
MTAHQTGGTAAVISLSAWRRRHPRAASARTQDRAAQIHTSSPGPDERAVQARLFGLLGVGGGWGQ